MPPSSEKKTTTSSSRAKKTSATSKKTSTTGTKKATPKKAASTPTTSTSDAKEKATSKSATTPPPVQTQEASHSKNTPSQNENQQPSSLTDPRYIRPASNSSADASVLMLGAAILLVGITIGYGIRWIQVPETPKEQAQAQQAQAQPTPQAQERPTEAASGMVGKKMNDFNLKDTNGTSYSLSSFTQQGKPVLLVIEATWCGYCQRENPSLEKLHETYGDQIAVITVSNKEDPQTVSNWVEQQNIERIWLVDSLGIVGASVGMRGTPHHTLVDKQGNIVVNRPGMLQYADLENMVKDVL